jgi:hypothetical protein
MTKKLSRAEILFESLKKETRYCILEFSVFIEEKASETIGGLLEIEWKESESLGYGSASLGFNNKISLLKDLKGVSKLSKTKFQTFMTIRNKFAHIAEIDSFDSYFKLIQSANERQKEIKSWYPYLKWDSTDIEGLYKTAYFLLTLDLFRVLYEIDLKHAFEKGKEKGFKDAQEIFISSVVARLKETENGNEILEEAIEKILNKNGG